MSLDSWIDDQALSMMRALAPARGTAPPPREPALEFGFDPVSDAEAALPDTGEPARIAPPTEPDPGTLQRLRSRLADIRRRAENGGVVRTNPAKIAPSVPVAPLPAVPPAESLPLAESVPASVPPPPLASDAETVSLQGETKVVSPFSLPDPAAPIPDAVTPEVVCDQPTELAPEPLPEPFAGNEMESIDAPERPAALEIPEGPLAVRLDAYRRWLEKSCRLAKPVVFDRHGCPLHAAEGLSSFIAAAVSLGIAWREACALTDPPGTLRAVHSAWGTGTMAVIPVPTRFGDLYVAGQAGAAIEPEMAAEIGSALRRAAGV